MEKTFYFLAGMQRSGNTVLSAILNQHPDVYSSSLGPMCEYLWLVYSASHENYIINTDKHRKAQLMSNMMNSYYSDVKKPIIIDRDKNWAHPSNITMLTEYINTNPKIIYTKRPILEVLASLIFMMKDTYLFDMKTVGWNFNPKISENDNICDYLMNKDSDTVRFLQVINVINNPNTSYMIHLVNYHDLLNTPQETMDGIYNFLGIESFKHNFNNIYQLDAYNDMDAGLPENMHKVRKTLSKSNLDVDMYISDYVREKYSYIDDLFIPAKSE